MKSGMLLSIAAVLFATVGADAVHPLCHHGHRDPVRHASPHSHEVLSSAYLAQGALAGCPVCVFQATSQLADPPLAPRVAEAVPCRDAFVSFRDSCVERLPSSPLRPRAPPVVSP